MLCIPITGPTFMDASHQVKESLLHANILEFRLDLFEEDDFEKLKALREKIKIPLIFTIKKRERPKIRELASLSPTYIDLEYDETPFPQALAREFSGIKLISSYHNFTHTPDDLEAILEKMKATPAHYYKIATQALSINDSLRMLALMKNEPPLLGMCMGEKGEITRILGPIFGAPWIYTFILPEQKTADGQLSVDELSIYTPHRLNGSTGIYGLIGNFVQKSISPFIHNRVFLDSCLDAVYVKMPIEEKELGEFFKLAPPIGLKGLSVTMPLKEKVIPFLDHIDQEAKKIKAVNTILFKNGKLFGLNTDGKGALDAIEAKMKVKNKKMVIVGAGGAARAIALEAIARGAKVTLLNRTKEKALALAWELGIDGGGLNQIDDVDYEILINTTPNPLPIDPASIRPHTLVMDIKPVPQMSPLLSEAARKNCTLVGYEMFINQAIAQYDAWFFKQLNRNHIHSLMQKEAGKFN